MAMFSWCNSPSHLLVEVESASSFISTTATPATTYENNQHNGTGSNGDDRCHRERSGILD